MTLPRDPHARSRVSIAEQIRSHAEELGLGLSEEDAVVLAGHLSATVDAVAAAVGSLEASSDQALPDQIYSDDE